MTHCLLFYDTSLNYFHDSLRDITDLKHSYTSKQFESMVVHALKVTFRLNINELEKNESDSYWNVYFSVRQGRKIL